MDTLQPILNPNTKADIKNLLHKDVKYGEENLKESESFDKDDDSSAREFSFGKGYFPETKKLFYTIIS